jgi:hypothetical protein
MRFSEKSLAALRLARRNKVEEIKKRTNYYETRELLERYEDGNPTVAHAGPKNGSSSRLQPQQLPVTPQRATPAVPPNTPANLPTPISPGLQSQLARMYPEQPFVRLMSLIHPSLMCRELTTASPASAQALV